MSKAQFFDFENRETYLCFCWARDSGNFDVKAAIAKAYDQTGEDDDYEVFGSVSEIVREKLAQLIADAIEDGLGASLDDLESAPGVLAKAHPTIDALIDFLLRESLSRIVFSTVAQALLVDAGKWAPDTDAPEIK